MNPSELLKLMNESTLGESLAESLYIYPLVEGSHLLSLAFSFGLIILTDLRLIGVAFPRIPASIVLHQLRPWVLGGFLVTFTTGILLTFASGPELISTPIFPLKLLFILLAGVNALWFEFKLGRSASEWAQQPTLPIGVRLAGWISLSSWSLVVILGRLIPYFNKTL